MNLIEHREEQIRVTHKPPRDGWLRLELAIEGRTIELDVSDVPNNPVQELLDAIDGAASGTATSVWWHLEPDGYLMYFLPIEGDIDFTLAFAPRSEQRSAQVIASTRGGRRKILMPFLGFLRDFQARSYQEPHWPPVDFHRLQAVKARLNPGET